MAQTSVTNAGPPFFYDTRFYQIRPDSTGAVFNAAGNFYFAGQDGGGIVPAASFRVDNIPVTGAGTLVIAKHYNLTGDIPQANIGDFAFSRTSDGLDGILYGGTGGSFSRITLNDAEATAHVVTVAVTPGVGGIGSAFFDRPTNRIVLFNNGASQFVAVTNFAPGAPTSVATTVANPTFTAAGFTNSATDGATCILAGDPPHADIGLLKNVTPNTTSNNVAGTTTVIPLTDPVPDNNQGTVTGTVSVSGYLFRHRWRGWAIVPGQFAKRGGVLIPLLNVGANMVFTLACAVTATGL